MSLLDESLARSLEAVKRDLETPLEQSLRAEVARLTERLQVLQRSYESVAHESRQAHDRLRYQVVPDRAGSNHAVSIRDVRLESTRHAVDSGRVLTARVMIDDMALRGFSEEAVRYEIARVLTQQLATHVYESHIAPERPERAPDPSYHTKAMHDSRTPFPGYPLQDTRPPLAGPLKFIK
jgi:hypothetical protein